MAEAQRKTGFADGVGPCGKFLANRKSGNWPRVGPALHDFVEAFYLKPCPSFSIDPFNHRAKAICAL